MPVILRHQGYCFFFFPMKGCRPSHPISMYEKGKRWLSFGVPQVSLEESYGMSPSELRGLAGFIENNKIFIRRRWDESFST